MGERLRPPFQEWDSQNLGLYPAQGWGRPTSCQHFFSPLGFRAIPTWLFVKERERERDPFRRAARISGKREHEETFTTGVGLEEGVGVEGSQVS